MVEWSHNAALRDVDSRALENPNQKSVWIIDIKLLTKWLLRYTSEVSKQGSKLSF